MGTGIFVMEGTASADGKTITLHGSQHAEQWGVMKHRAVWKFVDANTQTFEMYGTRGHGKEMKIWRSPTQGSHNRPGKEGRLGDFGVGRVK